MPSKKFDTAFYLKKYEDVRNGVMNPLVHYIKIGEKEGRITKDVINRDKMELLADSLNNSAFLILDHNGGGGTNKYILSHLVKNNREESEAHSVILARYIAGSESILITVIKEDSELLDTPFQIEEDCFYEYMKELDLSEILVNSLVTWSSVKRTLGFLSEYKDQHPNVNVKYMGHDFFCICPNYTLLDPSDKLCGVGCDEIECGDCIKGVPSGMALLDNDNAKAFSVTKWRSMWKIFLENTVDTFEVFSESSKSIMLKAYPSVAKKIVLTPHIVDSFDCCHIAVLGTMSVHKGQRVIEDLSRYLYALSIDDVVLYLYGGGAEIGGPNIRMRGPYQRFDLPKLFKEDKIDIVLIPSICSETFCYTMAESLALGYPTACFDVGGQADQARIHDHGIILDSQKPAYIYKTLMQIYNESKATLAVLPESTEKPSNTKSIIIQDRSNYDFLKWMYGKRDDKSHFVPEAKDSIKMDKRMPKVIAAYLPQFHDFEENVRWFGRGFSEWTNTAQTLPQFKGHQQPNTPIDVGFYNLDETATMHRQAELAKKYGISGFCVYYYWFSGVKLMDKPLQNLLNDESLDFPFFLFWANDDWTRSWGDGAFRETLYKSEMNPKTADRFMADILPYMKDSRYIRIDNKPVLLIYKVCLVSKDDYTKFVDRIQKIAVENGFDGIYLISPVEDYVDHNNIEKSIEEFKLNAMMEFHPIAGRKGWKTRDVRFVDPNCRSICYDVDDFINKRKYLLNTNAKVFAGLFPNWDNSPRRYNRGAWILQSTPENYKKWLLDLIKWTYEHHDEGNQFIFVNAWNEWAESAYLEPDTYNGYAYLQMTREALEEGLQYLDCNRQS